MRLSNFTYFIYLKKGTKYNTFFLNRFRATSESATRVIAHIRIEYVVAAFMLYPSRRFTFRSRSNLALSMVPENRPLAYSRIPLDYTLFGRRPRSDQPPSACGSTGRKRGRFTAVIREIPYPYFRYFIGECRVYIRLF